MDKNQPHWADDWVYDGGRYRVPTSLCHMVLIKESRIMSQGDWDEQELDCLKRERAVEDKKRKAAEYQIEHNKNEALLALGTHPDTEKQDSYNALGILQKRIKTLDAENMELRKKLARIESLLDEHS